MINCSDLISLMENRKIVNAADAEYLETMLEINHGSLDPVQKQKQTYQTQDFKDIADYLGGLFKERYKLGPQIAQGGIGAAHITKEISSQKAFLLKHLQYDNITEEHKERFIREIYNTLQVSIHPHIPSLRYFGRAILDIRHDEEYFYIMDFIEGQKFFDIINETSEHEWPNMQHQLLHAYTDILSAVEFLHCKSIFHRDCTVNNMLYDAKKNKAYLIDLGLSKYVDDNVPITAHNMLQGTPGYVAPECLLSENPPAFTTDIYTLGATLYTLVTRSVPYDFSGLDAEEMEIALTSWLHDTQTPLSSLKHYPSALSNTFDPIIQKATQFEPQNRYTTLHDFKSDYEQALKQITPIISQQANV